MSNHIEEKILDIVKKLAQSRIENIDSITSTTQLFEAKILNSYLLLELVENIEVLLDVELSEDSLTADNFESVKKLASIVERELTGANI